MNPGQTKTRIDPFGTSTVVIAILFCGMATLAQFRLGLLGQTSLPPAQTIGQGKSSSEEEAQASLTDATSSQPGALEYLLFARAGAGDGTPFRVP